MDNLIDFYDDDLAWKYEGDCSGEPLEDFFENYLEDKDTARRVDEMCAGCPVRQQCLQYAKGSEPAGVRATGVWAGMYLVQGKYHKPSNAHKSREQILKEEQEYDDAL